MKKPTYHDGYHDALAWSRAVVVMLRDAARSAYDGETAPLRKAQLGGAKDMATEIVTQIDHQAMATQRPGAPPPAKNGGVM